MAVQSFSLARTYLPDAELHRREIAQVANQAIGGKLNATGEITLTSSSATTIVDDTRVGVFSTVLFMPRTANAAAALAAGTMYVSSRDKKQFTITHANNAQTDRDFNYVVIG